MITPDSAPQVHLKVPSTLPQKVAAAVQVLEFLHEREEPSYTLSSVEGNPSMVSSGPRKLSEKEKATRDAALQYLIHYFYGEVND